MKRYANLLESLPAKTVVFAFGRFNPPTTGHELLIKLVKKLAQSQSADYFVYASATQDKKKNPLSAAKKIHYLKLMFPSTNFVAAGGDQRTFIEVAKYLNKKYKNLIMIAGSDRVPEYQKLLDKYNGTEFHFDSVKVVSAGERDPDADDASGMSASKMRAAAVKGDFATFKKGLPSSVREIDGKRLMNDIREGMGIDAIKEQIVLSTDALREKYFRKEIFHVGDIIESAGAQFEIISRGSNYLTVVDSNGDTSKKWIHECTVIAEGAPMVIALAPIHIRNPKKQNQQEKPPTPYQQGIAAQGKPYKNPHPFDPKAGADMNYDHNQYRAGYHKSIKEDVSPGPAPAEISFKGYTTKNLHHSADAAKAFQDTIARFGAKDPATVLTALKATDTYMKLNDMHLEQGKPPDEAELKAWNESHIKARDSLNRIGEFMHHQDYWHMHEHELQDMNADYTPETAGAEMADSYEPQGNQLAESAARFIQKVDQAANAAASGNHKNAKMHLDNARTFMLGVKSTDMGKISDAHEIYKNLRKKYSGAGGDYKIKDDSVGNAKIVHEVKVWSSDHQKMMHHDEFPHTHTATSDVHSSMSGNVIVKKGSKLSHLGNYNYLNISTGQHPIRLEPKHGSTHEALVKESLDEELTDKTIKSSDKIKVARVIADMLGVENAETMSPDMAVAAGLRKIKNKRMTPELIGVVKKMLALAKEVGIKVDDSAVPKAAVSEKVDMGDVTVNPNLTYNAAKGILRLKDFAKLKTASLGDLTTPGVATPGEVGHTLHGDDTVRKMKVMYKTEEVLDELKRTTMLSYKDKAETQVKDIEPFTKTGEYKDIAKNAMKRREKGIAMAKSKLEGVIQRSGTDKVTEDADLEESFTVKNPAGKVVHVSYTQGGAEKKAEELTKQTGQRHTAVYEREAVVKEDAYTADFKINPVTGRKSRAHQVNFAASKLGGHPSQDTDPEEFDPQKPTAKKANKPLMVPVKEEIEDDFDFEEEDLNDMADGVTEPEHILNAYDDEELNIIDSDTGEQLDTMKEETEQLDEVLSRMERMRSKMRFARTSSKRERRVQIALRTRSTPAKINLRARRLAVNLMKERIVKKPVDKMSIGEKERVERILANRKDAINRLAMKLAPRIRKIESDRLSHSKVTK